MKTDTSQAMSLVSRVHSYSADFLTAKLAEKGLPNFGTAHGFILFQLSQCEKMTLGELAEKVNRDKSTLTVLVKKLQAAELVELEENDSDKRSRFIKLTKKGKKYNDITSGLSKELLSTFFNGFNKTEQKQFCEFLERIKLNFEKIV